MRLMQLILSSEEQSAEDATSDLVNFLIQAEHQCTVTAFTPFIHSSCYTHTRARALHVTHRGSAQGLIN